MVYTLILMKKIMFLFLLTSSLVFAEKPKEAISYSDILNLVLKNFHYSLKLRDDLFTTKTLSFHNCNLNELPHAVIFLEQLKGLNLSYNPQLRSLPDDIGSLKNLTILTIWETSIESLPSSFRNLSLTTFCFSQTPLMDIFKLKKFKIKT